METGQGLLVGALSFLQSHLGHQLIVKLHQASIFGDDEALLGGKEVLALHLE